MDVPSSQLLVPIPQPESAEFRSLFRAHLPFVWRVLRRHGVPERELDDACQEVFLVVHCRSSQFEGRSSLRSWIYGIAVRTALGFRRKGYRVREQLPGELPEAAREAEQLVELERRETLEFIEQALSRLPARKREVFALYELEQLSMSEVAAALSIPENTALSRLYAAREQVRADLERQTRAQRSAAQLRKALP